MADIQTEQLQQTQASADNPEVQSSTEGEALEAVFHLFPKLALELRRMIWRKTLTPRVVEIVCDLGNHENQQENTEQLNVEVEGAEPDEVDQEGADQNNDWLADLDVLATAPRRVRGFYTYCALPVALGVCQESRNAVIDSYPMCFGSTIDPAAIRFNFDLDTLFVGHDMGCELFSPNFVLTQHEKDNLQHFVVAKIGMDEMWNTYAADGDSWDKLEGVINSFTKLKTLAISDSVFMQISEADDAEKNEEICDEFGNDLGKQVEFFDEFPQELLDRPDLEIQDDPEVSPPRYDHRAKVVHWEEKRAKFVWHWTRHPHKTWI
ncbi:hypothetical protein B0J14DRAFT_53244 [Halenospora varia]|nr:hypothetical protein B0J14DRAFT_53244 [Halenospora varia]